MNKKIIGSLIVLAFAVSGGAPLAMAQTASFTTPVAYGTTSSAVARVQQFLIDQKFLSATATGYYGPLTAAAVERFQAASGISPTYAKRVGALTLAALNKALSGQGSAPGVSGMSLPAVRTSAAIDVTSSTALLSGMVLAPEFARSVTPSFSYGTTMNYGRTTQTIMIESFAAARVTGLTCGTTYHYVFSVTNSIGTSNGGDAVFTTLPCGA